MKSEKYLVIVMLFTFLCCCKKNDYYAELSKTITEKLGNSLKNYDLIILIPGSGCTGCITKAEDYFLNNIGNKKILFILTNNHSNKGLLLKLGRENIENENVLVDKNNIYHIKGFEEKIYPMLIYVNDEKVIDIKPLNN